jgi:hypothetical protein
MQEQIPRARGTWADIALLRKGAICIMVDQRERAASCCFSVASGFRDTGARGRAEARAVIVPISNRRAGARFHIEAHPIIQPPQTGDPERDIVDSPRP